MHFSGPLAQDKVEHSITSANQSSQKKLTTDAEKTLDGDINHFRETWNQFNVAPFLGSDCCPDLLFIGF